MLARSSADPPTRASDRANGPIWPWAAATIALVPSREGAAAGVDTGIRLTTSDADADHAALQARGVYADPEVLRWPGVPPMFAFRDQDANRLVIVQQA